MSSEFFTPIKNIKADIFRGYFLVLPIVSDAGEHT